QRRRRWHLSQSGSAHFRDHLLHHFYGGRLFPDRCALQVHHGSRGQDRVWSAAPNQDLPKVPLGRSEPRRDAVQALRRGNRQSRRLIARALPGDSWGERMSDIEIAREGAVLSAAFARPEKKNAITGAMYDALIEAFEAAERDASVGAFVLSGKGGIFTAGNDI